MKKVEGAAGEASGGSPSEALVMLAHDCLAYFEDAAATAAANLENEPDLSGEVFASINTLTGAALRNLSAISEEKRRDLEAVLAQPAIARLEVLNDAGEKETIYVTPAGAPRPTWGKARVASYRSPVGRLAAVPVGTDVEVRTPAGTKSYELIERARLRPLRELSGWDARNTILDRLSGKPITVVSLRALLQGPPLGEDDPLALLNHLLQEDQAQANVSEGIRRSVIERMGLREQPLLDQYQDEIFRLPLDRQVAILGPPGSGKTTTLIKRLGLKLDVHALEDEQQLIARTIAGRAGHASSWIMFSPTELLRLYVKEAFARERVPASDHQIQVWDKFRRDTARNRLGILRSTTSSGAVYREALQNLQATTIADQISWFEDFDAWQKEAFWAELREHAERVAASSDPGVARLGVRLLKVAEGGAAGTSAPFHDFRASSKEVLERAAALQKVVDDELRRAFALQLTRDQDLLNKLLEFVSTLAVAGEPEDEPDEADAEDEEDDVTAAAPRADREASFEAYMRAMRAKSRALAVGRKLSPATRHGRIAEWLAERAPADSELTLLGGSVLLSGSLRRLVNPLRRYVRGIPARYRRFRRLRAAEGAWYQRGTFGPADLSPLEVDVVMLGMLRSARLFLRDPKFVADIDEPALAHLKAVRELMKTQVSVDEATDFSPVQLACMAALCDPETQSFLACGDFHQRMTTWGSRSVTDLKWVFRNIDVREIRTTYRHSRQLNALAHRVAQLSDQDHAAAVLPEHVDNEGVAPVLGSGLSGDALIGWLRERIFEIERLTQKLPSIAVLVNGDAQVAELAEQLQEALAERNIQCAACPGGQVRGNDNDVRVFDVQHIKGLEFEAVFFVGVDELAATRPELFDKFIYVGATRAAMYLGLTTAGGAPAQLLPVLDTFGSAWS